MSATLWTTNLRNPAIRERWEDILWVQHQHMGNFAWGTGFVRNPSEDLLGMNLNTRERVCEAALTIQPNYQAVHRSESHAEAVR